MNKTSDGIFIAGRGNNDPAKVTDQDILIQNGVTHVIDCVLIPDWNQDDASSNATDVSAPFIRPPTLNATGTYTSEILTPTSAPVSSAKKSLSGSFGWQVAMAIVAVVIITL
jgi:hypothetical protein